MSQCNGLIGWQSDDLISRQQGTLNEGESVAWSDGGSERDAENEH